MGSFVATVTRLRAYPQGVMNDSPPVQLRTGMLVFSADGDELGRIKELQDGCFKVDAPFAIDFWVAASAVASTEFGVARLALPKDAFNQRLERDIGHTGVHLHA